MEGRTGADGQMVSSRVRITIEDFGTVIERPELYEIVSSNIQCLPHAIAGLLEPVREIARRMKPTMFLTSNVIFIITQTLLLLKPPMSHSSAKTISLGCTTTAAESMVMCQRVPQTTPATLPPTLVGLPLVVIALVMATLLLVMVAAAKIAAVLPHGATARPAVVIARVTATVHLVILAAGHRVRTC